MDTILRKWCDERGIEAEVLSRMHVEYDQGVLKFPRRSLDNSELLGWKCRDLRSGRWYGQPSGINHGDTFPFSSINSDNTRLMICEGESDTVRLVQSTLPQTCSSDVICIPGANAFPAEWLPFLREYEQVAVFADGDDAGAQLPNRISSLLPGVRIVRLPDGEDVCSFLLQHEEWDLAKLYEIASLHIAPPAPIRKQNFVWDDAGSDQHRSKLVRIVLEDVVLRRRGSEFVGSCPFHEEKTPSFSVNSERGLYRCFGCGEGGDVISYLKKKHDMSFREAMNYLEDY